MKKLRERKGHWGTGKALIVGFVLVVCGLGVVVVAKREGGEGKRAENLVGGVEQKKVGEEEGSAGETEEIFNREPLEEMPVTVEERREMKEKLEVAMQLAPEWNEEEVIADEELRNEKEVAIDEELRNEKEVVVDEELRNEKEVDGRKEERNVEELGKRIERRISKLGQEGYVVTDGRNRYNMENYRKMEQFVAEVEKGVAAQIDLFEVIEDGSLICLQFQADNGKMTVTSGQMTNRTNVLAYTQKYELVRWEYTQKGYWIFEQNVKEEEERIGITMIRVKPLPQRNRDMVRKLIEPIGYQGNQLFTTTWDLNHLNRLNWNDLFPYLYQLSNSKSLDSQQYPEGIPQKLFEQTIKQYFPIPQQQIRQIAIYDSKTRTYPCNLLGCGNFYASGYDLPFPEIIKITKQPNQILQLTIDAISEGQSNDKAFTHILTIQQLPNNRFQYLSNKLIESPNNQLPEYRNRTTLQYPH